MEYNLGDIPLPSGYREPAEWAFARLLFPGGGPGVDGYYPRYQGDYRLGLSLWTQDFPRADRHFSEAVRRLTRIHVRPVEQVVDLDEGDAFDWPWLYAVQVGEWGLTAGQAAGLREYLLRGGFFFADDFHGDFERRIFEETMKRVFPGANIEEIPDSDALFHAVYDLDERYQIPGWAHLGAGFKNPIHSTGPDDGRGAHWYGIYDAKGRMMTLMAYNSDVGDAWEWADDARYPEPVADFAIRLGVNSAAYAMTH